MADRGIIKLVTVDGKTVTAGYIPSPPKPAKTPKVKKPVVPSDALVLRGRGYRDSDLAAALNEMSLDQLDRTIGNLEKDLSLMIAVRQGQRKFPMRDYRDQNRRIVDIEERFNEDDILQSEYGNEMRFKYFGAQWEMTAQTAASKHRPELAGRTVRYAYGNPVREG